ncbi:MAG TPA: hypothetical protein VGH14_18110 [Solirubrobacterales bacterium]|jgi:uncharacterized protein involved in exopolysaccharide biosynthesis
MGFVALVRVLWRRRIAVLVGLVAAVAVGVVGIKMKGPSTAATSSSSRVLIDTPRSLVATANAPGALTIYQRARVIADLMATESAEAEVARRAGLDPDEIAVLGPGAAAPPLVISGIAEQAAEVVRPVAPYLVSVEVTPGLPILTITATGADLETAVSVGNAAVATLPAVARAAPGGGDSVRVETLGEPNIATTVSGGRKTIAAMALVLFGVWCLAVVALDRPLRRRRRRRAQPRLRTAGGAAG